MFLFNYKFLDGSKYFLLHLIALLAGLLFAHKDEKLTQTILRMRGNSLA